MKTIGRALLLTISFIVFGGSMSYGDATMIDTFDQKVNLFGGRRGCYQAAPSRTLQKLEAKDGNAYLKIRFDKRNTGGKYGQQGGWCGWYTLLYKEKQAEPKHTSAEGKHNITFRVKGKEGDENFRINLKDRDAELADTPPPPLDIGSFLPEGRVTTEWQTATIPLDTFFVDTTKLTSFSINFERDCYPDGSASGTIYIDDIAFE